jgi:hypothetical protein
MTNYVKLSGLCRLINAWWDKQKSNPSPHEHWRQSQRKTPIQISWYLPLIWNVIYWWTRHDHAGLGSSFSLWICSQRLSGFYLTAVWTTCILRMGVHRLHIPLSLYLFGNLTIHVKCASTHLQLVWSRAVWSCVVHLTSPSCYSPSPRTMNQQDQHQMPQVKASPISESTDYHRLSTSKTGSWLPSLRVENLWPTGYRPGQRSLTSCSNHGQREGGWQDQTMIPIWATCFTNRINTCKDISAWHAWLILM